MSWHAQKLFDFDFLLFMVALLDLVLVKNIDRDFRSSGIAEPFLLVSFSSTDFCEETFISGCIHILQIQLMLHCVKGGNGNSTFTEEEKTFLQVLFFLPRHASCETRERRSRRFYFKITFFPLWFYHLAPDISPLICGCILKHQSGDSSVCWEEYLRAFIRTITYIRAINVYFEMDI